MSQTLRTLDYAVLQQCMHCGMCLPTCPTYDTTKRERNSPRGRIALMRAVADGELEVSREFADEMSYCLGCLACQTACPGRRRTTPSSSRRRGATSSARASAPAQRGRFWRARHAAVPLHASAGASRGRPSLAALSALGPGGAGAPLGGDRSAAGEAPAARAAGAADGAGVLERADRGARAARVSREYRVALLTGCVQDLVYPDVNRDTADVLLANGCAVDTPPLQPCCGSLHAHNGDTDTCARARAPDDRPAAA